jgi:peptidyl-prolyl cis-trans isomerase C
MTKRLFVIVALIAGIAAGGCGKTSDDAVLAKVGRAKITAADFKMQLEDLSPQMQQAVAADPKARKEFLDDLIGIEVVLQEARRQGLDKDAEYKKRHDEMRKRMEKQLRDAAKNELFNALLKKELMSKIQPPTDAEVREYYNTHREDIRKAAGGKDISLKEAEEKGLKSYVFQIKQREAYLEYAKGLKAKANVQVDEKALDSLGAALSQPQSPHGGMQLNVPPQVKEESKKEEKK